MSRPRRPIGYWRTRIALTQAEIKGTHGLVDNLKWLLKNVALNEVQRKEVEHEIWWQQLRISRMHGVMNNDRLRIKRLTKEAQSARKT